MEEFPCDFAFGVADADLQVIGEQFTLAEESSTPTAWTEFAQSSGRVFENQTPLVGVDRFHRFEEDAGLIRELGVRHYRTSVSMARTLTPTLEINRAAIAWYRRYFELLRSHGIKLYVTLFHWELPLYLSRDGGWENPATIAAFLRHVDVVHDELGDLIDEYFVLNEPWVIGWLGYYLGYQPPGKEDIGAATRAIHNLLLAQARGVRALKAKSSAVKVGTVYNLIPAYAADTTSESLRAQTLCDCYNNRWFLDPLYLGEYPPELVEQFGASMRDVHADDLAEMKVGAELSTLGINYYSGNLVQADPASPVGFKTVPKPGEIVNGVGWPVFHPPVHPTGLSDLLIATAARYRPAGLKSIAITENGTCIKTERGKDGKFDDAFRVEYLEKHFQQMRTAIRAGVPLHGYFLWTLLDNYEWAEGYRPDACFGIVHVDRVTLERTPKASYRWYRDVVKRAVAYRQLS